MTGREAQMSKLLIPMGGGYADLYPGLMKQILARAAGKTVRIIVLPTPYTSNPDAITDAERETNLKDAERRRFEIQEACKRYAPAAVTCVAEIAPIFTREDARRPQNLALFAGAVNAVFILGGDQGAAMQVIADSPLEQALADAHSRGAVIAGTSAGGAMQSAAMIADYSPNFAAGNSLDKGAVQLWNTPAQHGLSFGVQDAILDQHFFQRSRLGRLLEAISRPGAPPIGVGIDAYTGAVFDGTRIGDLFGLYTVAVLDAETYGAAAKAEYAGPRQTLSLRNVLVHLLAPGDFSYDLATRQHALAPPPAVITRTFDALALPAGAGVLILGGNLDIESPVYRRFLDLTSERSGPVLVVATGYANDRPAQRAADKIARLIGSEVETVVVSPQSRQPLHLEGEYSGIIVTGRDQSLVQSCPISAIKTAWLEGTPLLLDNAAAALAGAVFSAHPSTPEEDEEAERATQRSFLQGNTVITRGMDLLPVTVEPQLIANNRWGRFFSLAYNHPDLLALGVTDDTALEITGDGAQVLGDNALLVLDLRQAELALGDNRAFVIANGLLDIFAPGDRIGESS